MKKLTTKAPRHQKAFSFQWTAPSVRCATSLAYREADHWKLKAPWCLGALVVKFFTVPRSRGSDFLSRFWRSSWFHFLALLQLLILLLAATAPAFAAPVLKSLDPVGAQRGRTFILKLVGQDLRAGSELITGVPGTISRLAPPKDLKVPETELFLLVQLPADAPTGIYPIRVKNGDGISNVLLFSVGSFPEVKKIRRAKVTEEAAALNATPLADVRRGGRRYAGGSSSSLVQKLAPPVVVSGTLAEAEQDIYSFDVVAGQTLVFEVEARRLGSAIDPAIHILDASGREIASNDDAPLLGVDCRVQLKFSKAGEYRVVVHDTRFSGQEQNFYRLKMGNFLYAEGIFPLGWQRGKEVDVTFFGGNLPAPVTVHTSLNLPPSQTVTMIGLPAKSGAAGSLPVPFVVGDLPEMIAPGSEKAGIQGIHAATATPIRNPQSAIRNGQAPTVTFAATSVRNPQSQIRNRQAPADLPSDTIVNAGISRPGERHLYRLAVQPREKWLFEVDAAGLGTSRMQACLNIYDGEKKPLVSAVDAGGLNAKGGFSFSSPDRGVDPRVIFEAPEKVHEILLAVEDLNLGGGPDYGYRLRATRQWEDFSLELGVPYVNIPASGTALVSVRATRTGYQGPIKLTVPNAGDTLIVEGGNIPANGREGFLTITAKPGAQSNLVNVEVWGEATVSNHQTIRRRAVGPGLITSIAGEVGMSQRPFVAKWLGMELPAALTDPPPLHFELSERHIKVVQGLKREMKVKLLGAAPAAYSIRVSGRLPSGTGLKVKPVTLAPGKDVSRSYETPVEFAAEFDTPVARFDMVLEAKAEQSGRTTNILSPAITVDVVRGYALQFGSERIETRSGSTVELKGKVIREVPFQGEVTIHAEDLPNHVTSKPVEVGQDASDFTLQLQLGEESEPGEYNVRVVSSGKMEGRKDKAGYSIPDVKMKLKITRQASPAQRTGHELREDDKLRELHDERDGLARQGRNQKSGGIENSWLETPKASNRVVGGR